VIPSETGFTLVQKNSHVAKKLGSTFAQQQTGALKILQDFYFYFFLQKNFSQKILSINHQFVRVDFTALSIFTWNEKLTQKAFR
jgi:hypothetical protein